MIAQVFYWYSFQIEILTEKSVYCQNMEYLHCNFLAEYIVFHISAVHQPFSEYFHFGKE